MLLGASAKHMEICQIKGKIMKLYLSLITAAAFSLVACGGESKPAETATPVATASEVAPASAPVASETTEEVAKPETEEVSAECSTVIDGNDQMKFDVSEITVKSSCEKFTITLKHSGNMPVAAMGHNVVVTKVADKDAVVADGQSAGVASDYVKVDDARIVAHTKLIGGGEETSVTFDPKKLDKDSEYVFFCSFPGHAALMHGTVNLVD